MTYQERLTLLLAENPAPMVAGDWGAFVETLTIDPLPVRLELLERPDEPLLNLLERPTKD